MRSDEMSIRVANGGYILTEYRYLGGNERIFPTLEAVFDYLLLRFEGRSDTFLGDKYGKVEIRREKARHE